jgi:outer membrane receptor for ferrienterochelin and colicins
VVWHAAPAWRWRANVARGFRAPSFKELRYTFINGAAGYQIIGSDSLRPESSWSTSVGGTWSPTNSVTIDIDAYRNALTNLISTRSTGTNAAGLIVYQNVNVERARTEGMEIGVQQSFAATDVSVGYDYLRARDLLTGATLDGRATHTARVALARRWRALAGTQADLSARYISSAPRGTVTQSAFLSLDGQLRMGVSRAMVLSLGATNLLDRRPSGWTAAYQRQVTIGVQARLGDRP